MPFGSAFETKTDVYGFQTLYREIGYYISRLEQYERSLKFFDEAIKKTPNDKRALIGRSKARTKVIQYEGALEDVNKALSVDPNDLVVLADKALNTYLCCEFEEGNFLRGNKDIQEILFLCLKQFSKEKLFQLLEFSADIKKHKYLGLVENTRLAPLRQKPDNFTMGVMQCSDAIENCLGERAGRPLRDHFKIIRYIAWKKNYAVQKPYEPKPSNKPKKKKKIMLTRILDIGPKEPVQPKKVKPLSVQAIQETDIVESLHSLKPDNEPVPKYNQPFPFRPLQNYSSNIENYMAEKYLDCMYLDKIFLKQLQTRPGASSPNKEGSKRIHQLAKNCFKTVTYKQELLRTRRPFYFIKYQEARVSGALKDRQQMELHHQQHVVKRDADLMLNRMLEAHDRKDLKTFLDLVEKLKRFCDSRPKKLLPDKDKYMEQIYEKICTAFYDIYRVNPNQSMFTQNRRIYSILGLPLSREPSSDSVTDQFKNVFIDYQKKIAEFSARLERADSPEEICWYYHELARYEYDIKHYDLSRLYAKKCIYQAKNVGNSRWMFNSSMLMLKCNLAEHNKNDAKNDIALAQACASELQDDTKLDYLQLCQKIIENVEFEDMFGTKQLEKRENKIIQMMASSKMKDEVAHLFRQMAAMPASRRMVVMPGVRATEKSGKSMKSRTMSIMPGATTRETPEGTSGLKDFIDF